MRFNGLDLNLLVALDHMLNLRSISRAAEKMNLTQSAMSNALARLRTHFEDPLLVQSGRKMELTPRAESMCDPLREILVRIDATISAKPFFDAASSDREFRILLSDYSMVVLMPYFFQNVYAVAPSIRFKLLPQITEPYRVLEQGEADLLISPAPFCSPDHPSEELFIDRFICLVCKHGKFGTGPISRKDFTEAGHIKMIPPNTGISFDSRFIEDMGINRRIEIVTHSFSTIPSFLPGTDRIAVAHQILACQVTKTHSLRMVDLPVPSEPLVQAIQWQEFRDHDPAIIWLRAQMHRAAQRMLDEVGAGPHSE